MCLSNLQLKSLPITQVLSLKRLAVDEIFDRMSDMDTKELTRRLIEAEQLIASIRKSLSQEFASPARKRSQEEMDRLVDAKICLRCGEPIGDEDPDRGLHHRCYQKLRRDKAIPEAEAMGHILPVSKPGRKSAPAILEDGIDIVNKRRISYSKKANRDRK